MATVHHPVFSQPTPVQLKSLAVFTDFSSVSKLALRYAALLARRFQAKISLVNSLPFPIPSYAMGVTDASIGYMAQVDEDECNARGSQLEAELSPSWLQGIDSARLVWRGGIKQYITEHPDLDLVVLGTSGKARGEKAFIGSTAEEIFRWSRVPVLTVGPECVWPEEIPKRILYVTDFSKGAEKAFDYALLLTEKLGCELVMLHVVEGDEGTPSYERTLASVTPMDGLQNMVPDLVQLAHKPELIVSFGPAAETILREAQERNVDLIVMGARGAGVLSEPVSHFGGGVAYKVATHAKHPVLTVRH